MLEDNNDHTVLGSDLNNVSSDVQLVQPQALILPEVRKELNTQKPNNHHKKPVVQLSKVLYTCFKVELGRLKDKYTDTTNYQTMFKFESEAKKLGRDYGLTVILTVDHKKDVLHPDVYIDTVEQVELIPGEEWEWELFSKILHGHKHISDVELFNKTDLTAREVKLLDGEIN